MYSSWSILRGTENYNYPKIAARGMGCVLRYGEIMGIDDYFDNLFH
jgi:hypothetical protein